MFGQNDNNNPQEQPTAPETTAPAVTPPPTPKVYIDDVTGDLLGHKPGEPTTPVAPSSSPLTKPTVAPAPAAAAPSPTATSPEQLVEIRKQALKDLTPLVDKLDQTPEEKFRTAMMLIQASDNDALIKMAYDAAQKITDDATRAQALLDVVNEINYFTQGAPEQA